MDEEQYSDIELKMLDNKEIKELFLRVRSKILQKKDIDNRKEIEIYYCYIVKEIERRNL